MSLPIVDINAGDTMSGMVDKINYNFTLLSLKGGGPAGIQGIQGLRGPVGPQGMQGIQGARGNMIYDINPNTISDLSNYNLGDTFIYDGVIYQIVSNETGNGVQQITNLYDNVQSPFGFPENDLQTINPRTNYEKYPFILGIGTGETVKVAEILSHTSDDRGVLNISSDENLPSFIKFFSGTALTGTIKSTDGGQFVLQGDTANGIQIRGGGFHINMDQNGISLPVDRIRPGYEKTSFIVSTKINTGTIDNNWNKAWCTGYDNDCAALFPFKSGIGSTSSIGLKTNLQHRIDQICLTKNANVFYDTGAGVNDYISIKADEPSPNASLTDTMSLSKYGVAIGGIKPVSSTSAVSLPSSTRAQFENDVFSIKLSTPAQWATNQKYGTMMTITSLGDNAIPGVVSSDSITFPEFASISPMGNSDWAYRGTIVLSTNTVASAFRKCNYSNLIVADRKAESGSMKNANDTLHIHGADSTRYAGNDIVVSGGNNLGGSNSNSVVGGDVYLSGGSAFGAGDVVHSDLKRCGNVIIGINPLHHSGCFDSSNFTSTKTSYETNNTSTNPDGVGFFDINNISMHGNRIVIDSNANFRKITDGYTKTNGLAYNHSTTGVQAEKKWRPYASSPENTTLQISAVNTISHVDPIVLDRKDICSHQFMSGVMQRAVRFYKTGDGDSTKTKPSIEVVDPSNLTNTYVSNNKNSIYFITEHVWQKVGNIVNVNVFGRWVVSSNSSQLFHMADHFFNVGVNEPISTGLGWYGFGEHELLKQWLLDPNDSTPSYLSGPGRDWPMTVLALPVVVEDMCSTYCYGNGNIYTEDNETAYGPTGSNSAQTVNPTGSVLHSTPVVIGAYHRPPGAEQTSGNRPFGSPYGNRSALYSNADNYSLNDRFNAAYHKPENTNGYDFASTSIKNDDEFRYDIRTAPTASGWTESNYTHTEAYDSRYCYVYPEMLTELFNEHVYQAQGYRISKRLRPCIGMYTWISLNYSYSVMDGFDGEVLPMTNRPGGLIQV